MPPQKTPLTTSKKKTTASTTKTKVTTRQQDSLKANNDGSNIEGETHGTNMTFPSTSWAVTGNNPVITMLVKINDTNTHIMRWMDALGE